jgi:3-oxoacyl-[acyl-carrier-protein] synthase-1
MSAQTLNLAITAVGMVSSLGLDAVTGCAAARAGLVRPTSRTDFMVQAGDTDEEVPLQVCAVPTISDGFTGLGRLLRLGTAALADLQHRMPLGEGGATGLLVNLPSGDFHTVWERQREEAAGYDYTIDGRYEMALRREKMADRVVPGLVRLTRIEVDEEHQAVVFGDQAGFASLLLQAAGWLAAGRIKRCLVGGIGSYLDRYLLEALHGLHKLNVPSQPAGLVPGEGAAFLLVEPSDTRSAANGSYPTVGAVGLAAGPRDRLAGDPPRGTGLARAVAAALEASSTPDVLVGDLNGEASRASDWGHALPALIGDHPALQYCFSWYPAASFGDTGAAAGPIGACFALHLLRRRSAGSALLSLATDSGTRAAVTLHTASA